MVTPTRAALMIALMLAARPVFAEPAPRPETTPASESAAAPAPPAGPRLHHAPVSAASAHDDLVVVADIVHPEQVARAVLVYRRADEGWLEVPFLRGEPGPYAARIPARDVIWPGFEYTIELELTDGRRQAVFASRSEPFRVLVPEDLMDVRERVQAERLEGRRSVVSASGEAVDFGRSLATVELPDGTRQVQRVPDRYYRIEAAYVYRPLRFVNEFGVRLGVVRGQSPVPEGDGNFDVGLNYAAPSVRLRLADLWHLEGQFLTSVTEVGFSLGLGGALHIGDVYGSKLVVGFESIEVFGTRLFSRVDVRASDALRLSPIVEATDMPHADRFGVRLLGEAGYELIPGFELALRGGYQARDATSGGPSGGITVTFSR